MALSVESKWDSGFTGKVTVSNPGTTAINGWTLVFDLNRTITSSWSAIQKSKSGSTYTFTNESWTGNIPAGGSVSFGIQVDGPAKDALLNQRRS